MGCVLSVIECLLPYFFEKVPRRSSPPRASYTIISSTPRLPGRDSHTSSSISSYSSGNSMQYSNRQVQNRRPTATVSPTTYPYTSSSRSTYSAIASVRNNNGQVYNSSSRSTFGGTRNVPQPTDNRKVQASRSSVTRVQNQELSISKKTSIIDCGKCFSCSHVSGCSESTCETCRKIVNGVKCQNKWCTRHQCRESSLYCSCTTERLLEKYKKGRKSVYGHFKCNECGKKWTSAFAWVQNGYLLKQACKDCNFSVEPFKVVSFIIIKATEPFLLTQTFFQKSKEWRGSTQEQKDTDPHDQVVSDKLKYVLKALRNVVKCAGNLVIGAGETKLHKLREVPLRLDTCKVPFTK